MKHDMASVQQLSLRIMIMCCVIRWSCLSPVPVQSLSSLL